MSLYDLKKKKIETDISDTNCVVYFLNKVVSPPRPVFIYIFFV